eukprot:g3028.t1
MGTGASTSASSGPSFDDVGKWSKEDVGEQVAAIGGAFEKYKQVAIDNDVDGKTLLGLDDDDFEECGVSKMHRKKIRMKLDELQQASQVEPDDLEREQQPALDGASDATESLTSARRFSSSNSSTKLFVSYPRGEQTTPFARWVKGKLEHEGYAVWMDEEGIMGGADFMQAIGDAIVASAGVVAIIDAKFCGSTYCNNELALAQGSGCRLFPCIFRGMTFDAMPNGLKYMLASINCISFPDQATDDSVLRTMLDHMHDTLSATGRQEATRSMRHGDPAPSTDLAVAAAPTPGTTAAANAAPALALVPASVPELPGIVSERLDVLVEMRGHLLGFMAGGTVSVSSQKKKSAASMQGQGGVGKTTLAVMLVRDKMVQRAFDKIAWVSVGQTPELMEIQRSLFHQLTGNIMSEKTGATGASQLQELQNACQGKNYLVVLDDVWKAEHEKLLNCVDSDTTSKLLVTTRICGLLKQCEEVNLNLLSEDEAIELLLSTGEADDSVDGAQEAARAICKLVGNLPLYLRVCGGMIKDYGGSNDWQEELVAALQENRLHVLGEEDSELVQRVVGTSLGTIGDVTTEQLFTLIGLCPEDVPVPFEFLQILWSSAAPDGADKGASARVLRRCVSKLLERNLLVGSFGKGGVYPHDIVRDFMRAKLAGGGDDTLQYKQRNVTRGIMAAVTKNGEPRFGSALGSYLLAALEQHMTEALQEDAVGDAEAKAWLDSSDSIFGSCIIKAAGNF